MIWEPRNNYLHELADYVHVAVPALQAVHGVPQVRF
jgi:hypothetical protein